MSNTPVDGIAESGLSLIGNGDHSLAAVVLGHLEEQLRCVAGPEHLVHCREAGSTVLVAEVRGEDAVGGALAPQELACPAGRARGVARARRAHV